MICLSGDFTHSFASFTAKNSFSRAAAIQQQRAPRKKNISHEKSRQTIVLDDVPIPIGSMYAIYGNIYHQYTPNVSIYTGTMDPMGYEKSVKP